MQLRAAQCTSSCEISSGNCVGGSDGKLVRAGAADASAAAEQLSALDLGVKTFQSQQVNDSEMFIDRMTRVCHKETGSPLPCASLEDPPPPTRRQFDTRRHCYCAYCYCYCASAAPVVLL